MLLIAAGLTLRSLMKVQRSTRASGPRICVSWRADMASTGSRCSMPAARANQKIVGLLDGLRAAPAGDPRRDRGRRRRHVSR